MMKRMKMVVCPVFFVASFLVVAVVAGVCEVEVRVRGVRGVKVVLRRVVNIPPGFSVAAVAAVAAVAIQQLNVPVQWII